MDPGRATPKEKKWPICQLSGFWQDRSVRENGAQLDGPRVSNFLSHRILKSLTFRIYGKLKFPCTRKGAKNHPFCPGSIQDTFIIFPRYLTNLFCKMILQTTKSRESKSCKSESCLRQLAGALKYFFYQRERRRVNNCLKHALISYSSNSACSWGTLTGLVK